MSTDATTERETRWAEMIVPVEVPLPAAREQQRAEQEQQRAERLAARLRELGEDPDAI